MLIGRINQNLVPDTLSAFTAKQLARDCVLALVFAQTTKRRILFTIPLGTGRPHLAHGLVDACKFVCTRACS